jgi:hypothetical protein
VCETINYGTSFVKLVTALGVSLICAAAAAGDLHPIVEVQSGYVFGATREGKWIKADETAKALTDGTTYRIYGLTQSLGEAKAGQPKAVEDVCTDTLTVSLSPKPEEGCDRARGAMECAAAKATNRRYNSAGLRRCGARFFENERNRATERENRQHQCDKLFQ